MRIKSCKSLKIESVVITFIALVLGVSVFFAAYQLSNVFIEKFYLEEDRYQQRVDRDVERFREYVKDNEIASTDTYKIESWFRECRYQYFMLYNEQGLMLVVDDKNTYEYSEGEVERDGEDETYSVEFTDGSFDISIIDFSEMILYDTASIASVILAAIAIFAVILAFTNRVIKRIRTLSQQVDEIATTDINKPLYSSSHDEIGRLSSNIEDMRSSIIYHYEKERESLKSNRELITNMSHDLRTPLTAIIGYNEVIINEEADTELIKQCAQLSLEKAYQLKEMSDELFKYFLVYDASNEIELNLQKTSVHLLLQQIIGEQALSLQQQGIKVEVTDRLSETEIETDVLMLKRVFDNVFSNIRKYADKNQAIEITLWQESNSIVIKISDTPVENSDAPGSGIGLRSCARIMQILGGRFNAVREGNLFVTTIELNLENNDS